MINRKIIRVTIQSSFLHFIYQEILWNVSKTQWSCIDFRMFYFKFIISTPLANIYMTVAFSIIQTYCSVEIYEIFFLCSQGGTFFFLFWIFTDSSYLHQILYFYQTRHHQIMQNFCMPQIHVKNPTYLFTSSRIKNVFPVQWKSWQN